MGRKRGPRGLVPYRKRQKSGHQKRSATIEPTPELLIQKARAVGREPSAATRDQSCEQLDILLATAQISERQHQAATIFESLRVSIWGRPREVAGYVTQIHSHISSVDAPDRLLTDDEREELRQRREWSYEDAVHHVRRHNPRWLEAAHRVLMDGRTPDGWTIYAARRCFDCLADYWKLTRDS